jgi:ABC-type transport system involved in multi-copper enzyme maturation permease subunit
MSIASLAAADRVFHAVVVTEFSKLRRSKVTWISFAAYAFMVGVAAFFVWLMGNPDVAASLGLIGQKASLALGGVTVGWEAYLGLVLEMSGLAGMMLASVILTYAFGREYAEGTAKNMLALPVPRWMFVAAKLLVSAIWFAALTAWAIALSRAAGSLAGLGAVTEGEFAAFAGKVAVASLLGYACAAASAWIAVETRGYFAPLGYAIFAMLLAVIFGATEWGRWTPWSVLLWYSGASGPGKVLVPGSFVVVGIFFAASAALILRHETRADNAQ